ncbi:MAG: helix-turn-helix transcriptional regulator [Pseudomonadota bacterium]
MRAELTPHVYFRQSQRQTWGDFSSNIECQYIRGMAKHYIREWRKFRGLTQKQLTERMEHAPGEELISQMSVSRIERGTQPYSQPILEALAIALDVTPAMLLEVDPCAEGQILDFLRRIDDAKRPTVMAMIEAALRAS